MQNVIREISIAGYTVAKVDGLGHSDGATRLRYYVDVFPEDLEEAAEMLAER